MLWVLLGMGILILVQILYSYLFQYRQAGRVIFSQKQPNLAWLAGFLLLLSGYFVYDMGKKPYYSEAVQQRLFWSALFYAFLALSAFYHALMYFKVMDQGLFFAGILLKWSDIDSYLWDTYHKRLILTLKKRNPWHMGKKTLRIRLSLEDGFQAEGHMKEHLTKAAGPWE